MRKTLKQKLIRASQDYAFRNCDLEDCEFAEKIYLEGARSSPLLARAIRALYQTKAKLALEYGIADFTFINDVLTELKEARK